MQSLTKSCVGSVSERYTYKVLRRKACSCEFKNNIPFCLLSLSSVNLILLNLLHEVTKNYTVSFFILTFAKYDSFKFQSMLFLLQSEGMYLNEVASKVNESFAPIKKEVL